MNFVHVWAAPQEELVPDVHYKPVHQPMGRRSYWGWMVGRGVAERLRVPSAFILTGSLKLRGHRQHTQPSARNLWVVSLSAFGVFGHARIQARLQHAEQKGFMCGDGERRCCSRGGSQQGRGEAAGCPGRAAGAASAEGQAGRHCELGTGARPRGTRLLRPGRSGGPQRDGGGGAAAGSHPDSPEATAGRTSPSSDSVLKKK